MFEIKAKDMRGRVGVLKTKHGNVKTPALMPVIHPRKQAIDVKKYGADMVITNAYLIYKDEDLKQKAIDEGLHELINFDGPVMTDSGSLLIVGLVHTGITYCLYFSSLKELPGQTAAILSYIDPLVAVVIGVVVLGEPLSWQQLIGGGLILGFTLWNEL